EGCETISNESTITIETTPVAGLLYKTPDVANVCEGTNVSASLSAGSGGNGTDELQYSTDEGKTGRASSRGTNIPTSGVSEIQIRTRRMADYCDDTDYTIVTWNVEATPVAGSLTKVPNDFNVCEGTDISASLTAGSGGNGTDELQYSTDEG